MISYLYEHNNSKKSSREEIYELIEVDKTAIWSIFYKPYTTETGWNNAFDKGDIYFIIYNDIIVGNIYYFKKNNTLVYLDEFLLKPKYRNHWIWTEALKLIIQMAIGQWYTQMELITHPDNLIAQSVYRHNWFSQWEIIENYYGDGESRIYFLNKNLWNS